jgi:hypothetical protein
LIGTQNLAIDYNKAIHSTACYIISRVRRMVNNITTLVADKAEEHTRVDHSTQAHTWAIHNIPI